MTNQPTQQPQPPKPPQQPPASAGEDLTAKHLLDSPTGPTPAPNPESAPGGDKVGGDMTTAPFTGAPLKGQPTTKSSSK